MGSLPQWKTSGWPTGGFCLIHHQILQAVGLKMDVLKGSSNNCFRETLDVTFNYHTATTIKLGVEMFYYMQPLLVKLLENKSHIS